jgi:hypothetical protein
MQMFGGDYENILADDEPGNRFNTFWEAFVSLIVVYTSETWTVSSASITHLVVYIAKISCYKVFSFNFLSRNIALLLLLLLL